MPEFRKSDAYKIQLSSEDGCATYYPKLIINKTQCQLDSPSVSLRYLAYRWFHAALNLAILLVSIFKVDDPSADLSYYFKWPIYLTNWAICINVAQALIGVVLAVQTVRRLGEDKGLQKYEDELRLYRLYWSLQTSAVTIAFGVSIMYWCFIYNPGLHQLNAPNLASHFFNSIVMGLDFLVARHPVRPSYAVYPFMFVSSYIVFSLIYYAYGGLSRLGDPAVYKAMDWRRPKECLVFLSGGYIVIITTFVIVWSLDKLKRRFLRVLRRTATATSSPPTPSSDSLI